MPYSDTSSTSESEQNSIDSKRTGYEKIIKKLEKKKGKISKEDFSIVSLIGTGSYGKVFLVRKNDTKKIYAMKVLRKSFIRKYK
jgi:serum/glucocorticoid-regulated kinase 2